MKICNYPTALLLLFNLLFLSACLPDDDDEVVLACTGGFFMEFARVNSDNTTSPINNLQTITVNNTIQFGSNYSGTGDECWNIEGPCIFNPGTRQISFAGNPCSGTYTVQFEFEEAMTKYCDEITFEVTPFVSDTMIGPIIPNPIVDTTICFL